MMVKLLGLVFAFMLAAFLGWQVIYAQTPTPTPLVTPTPTPLWEEVIEQVPEGAPRTGFGGLR
jgi:ABC-type nitrate/sulfonate/bicarbonate transport system permease component